jgi:hypothetical protein
MIITKTVQLVIINSMKKYYINLGYVIPKEPNPIIEINVNDLSKGSSITVECKCDICNTVYTIPYNKYLKNIKNSGYYSCRGICSRNKFKQTNLQKYGVENVFQNEEIKDKIKKVILKKYGVENPNQLDETKKKSKKTKLEKYGNENYVNIQKIKNTCLEKYGVDHVSKTDFYVDKCIKTCIKRYGLKHYSQTEEYKKRCKKTCLEKYGTESSNSNNQVKEKKKKTKLEKYSNENYINLEKMKQTSFEKYGVNYPIQNIDIFNKQRISGFKLKHYKETNLTYQGSYELDFLEKFSDKINIKNGTTIKYSTNKVYFPDFFISELNLIIEIKSEYTLNLHKEKNLEKQKACLEQGFNFIFIIDKDYTKFNELF